MVLYKNVDVIDLESILSKGILSLNKSGNNNWGEHKRANNSCDVVYLFKPLTDKNSFCNYGTALLEINIPDNDVKENQLLITDVNKGKYIEYITDEVPAKYIKAIYIPKIFKGRMELSEDIIAKITWCGIKANYWGDEGKDNCPDDILEQFAKTAKIMAASDFNFFRGITDRNTMIDLYDIQYVF